VWSPFLHMSPDPGRFRLDPGGAHRGVRGGRGVGAVCPRHARPRHACQLFTRRHLSVRASPRSDRRANALGHVRIAWPLTRALTARREFAKRQRDPFLLRPRRRPRARRLADTPRRRAKRACRHPQIRTRPRATRGTDTPPPLPLRMPPAARPRPAPDATRGSTDLARIAGRRRGRPRRRAAPLPRRTRAGNPRPRPMGRCTPRASPSSCRGPESGRGATLRPPRPRTARAHRGNRWPARAARGAP